MSKSIASLFVIAILLNACTSSSPVNSPTPPTPVYTDTPVTTATQTEMSRAEVNVQTNLYTGPSNIDFEKEVALAPGQKVIPLGVFGDFVQVSYQDHTGFVPTNA